MQAETAAFPGFRHVDPAPLVQPPLVARSAIIAADGDFAPWSFVGADGKLHGIAVDIAAQACAVSALQCEIRALPYADLLPQLRAGQVDAVISGPQPSPQLAAEFQLTRPYFRSLARFVVRTGTPLTAPDVRSLAGRRIGMVANTSHARFLEQYYGRSALTPFDTPADMLEALRTGQLDAAFADAMNLAFWLDGEGSKGCCSYLGKAFMNEASFTRNLGFVVAGKDTDFRARLDAGLDQLESKGVTAAIFSQYLPHSIW